MPMSRKGIVGKTMKTSSVRSLFGASAPVRQLLFCISVTMAAERSNCTLFYLLIVSKYERSVDSGRVITGHFLFLPRSCTDRWIKWPLQMENEQAVGSRATLIFHSHGSDRTQTSFLSVLRSRAFQSNSYWTLHWGLHRVGNAQKISRQRESPQVCFVISNDWARGLGTQRQILEIHLSLSALAFSHGNGVCFVFALLRSTLVRGLVDVPKQSREQWEHQSGCAVNAGLFHCR